MSIGVSLLSEVWLSLGLGLGNIAFLVLQLDESLVLLLLKLKRSLLKWSFGSLDKEVVDFLT